MSDRAIKDLHDEFNDLADASERLCYITRDAGLQRDMAGRLDKYADDIKTRKQEIVKAGREDVANAMLAIECMAKALAAELRMWVLLKESVPDAAWDQLVAAQDNTRWAMKSHAIAEHLMNYAQRLAAIERMLFPRQLFVSSGLIVKSSECSICGAEYGDCNHVKGRCYNGEMCARICKDVEFREVSLVEEPADKRCRAMHMTLEGEMRNVMTWLPVLASGPQESGGPPPANDDKGISDTSIPETSS